MASAIKVKVHPVVLFSIIESYERRPDSKSGKSSEEKVIGTLLGSFDKGVVEVTNCFTVPHSDANNEAQIHKGFNKEMFELFKKSNPAEMPVGWFSTHPEVNELSMCYHDYFMLFVNGCHPSREQLPVVLMTLDVALIQQKRMGLRAYVRVHAGIPQNDKPQATIFMPIDVETISFEAEQIGVDFIQAGIEDSQRKVHLLTGIQHIRNTAGQMINWLELVQKYVHEVLAGTREPDATVGRRLMELVSSVNQVQPEHFEQMLTSSMKDYLMITYLGQLAKAQLSLHEQLVRI